MNPETNRIIKLPHAGIVVMVGPSNSGKTYLLQKCIEEGVFLQTEVVSSDQFRMMVGDTEFIDWKNKPKLLADVLYNEYQLISEKAFEAMDRIISMRCRLGKLTIVDATHLHSDDRKKYVDIAGKYHVPAIAIVLDVSENILLERDDQRNYSRGRSRVKQQVQQFKRGLRVLKDEGFQSSYTVRDDNIAALTFARLSNPLLLDIGDGIDIIGDIHGCYAEMLDLLSKLGYEKDEDGLYLHPEGRKLVSVGDVMSRGPESLRSMQFWKAHVGAGKGYMIDSNHGWKIARWLDGRNVSLGHGDEKAAAEFELYEDQHGKEAANQLKTDMKRFLLEAPSHLVFCQDGVRQVVVAHAGIKDHFIGKESKRIQDYCRYGDTDGMDELGKPIRKDWYVEHDSGELIVWGHDPRPQPTMAKNTLNIDQGVVFGGQLTAFRYPEKGFFSVSAVKDYAEDPNSPLIVWEKKRFAPPNLRKFIEGYSVLSDKYGEIAVKAETIKTAIDSISHFTVPIEELVYIPPTMSPPPAASTDEHYLEHPREAFAYYRSQGVTNMIAEKKHMGSRAVLLLFRNPEVAMNYVGREILGTIYTRTGRSFFDQAMEQEVLEKLNKDLQKANYFEKHQTDLILLDAEIVPWNLKAKELISTQYAHVSEAAILDRTKLLEQLKRAKEAGRDVQAWVNEFEEKLDNSHAFQQVFQKYCWDTDGLEGVRIAPFHTLAHSGETFFNHSHLWHMEKNREFAELSDLFIETEFKLISDDVSQDEAIRWWEEITEDGHEGIVIKPELFLTQNMNKLVQPAIKARGRKYLQIIYGMDYLFPKNLKRLKERKTSKKQRHALMEFALGVESIERFIRKEPIERIHECVLASLALESDPVDPRL